MTKAHRRALLENTNSEWEHLEPMPLRFLREFHILTQNEYDKTKSMNLKPYKQKIYLQYLLTRKPDSVFDVLLTELGTQGTRCRRLCAAIKANCKYTHLL